MSEATKSAAKSAPKGKAATAKAKAKAKTKKARGQVVQGKAYIQATFNNTIFTLTDMNGNTLSWSSAGVQGFKGPKKATPFAASMIVKDAVEKAADYGLKDVHVFMSGVGQGREGALRAINANGLNVLSIKDITPIPHNGCRQPSPRRV